MAGDSTQEATPSFQAASRLPAELTETAAPVLGAEHASTGPSPLPPD
jgi:hypothetical protein